jgi:hypothetical protein
MDSRAVLLGLLLVTFVTVLAYNQTYMDNEKSLLLVMLLGFTAFVVALGVKDQDAMSL